MTKLLTARLLKYAALLVLTVAGSYGITSAWANPGKVGRHVASRLVDEFAVFAHSRAPRAITHQLAVDQGFYASMANGDDPNPWGLLPAQIVVVPIGATSVALVPGASGACVATTQPGTTAATGEATYATCGPDTNVLAHGLMGEISSPDGTITKVYGMVPNGVTSVTITDGGGASHVVAVSSNAYTFSSTNGASSISYTRPSGETFSAQVP
jgi:hypothetical protein